MKKNNTLIIILICIIVLLGGFIVYDKLLSKNDNPKQNEECKENTSYTVYDEEEFNDVLKIFLLHVDNYTKNIDNFDNSQISTYLFYYFYNYGMENNEIKYEDDGELKYNVSKSEMDEVVLRTFGKKDYEIITSDGRDGIRKIDDKTYQIFCFATGWASSINRLTNITKQSNNAIVEYTLYNNPASGNGEGKLGIIKFHLVKNEDNWNITKIEYKEAKN